MNPLASPVATNTLDTYSTAELIRRSGSGFFLSTPRHTLLTEGVHRLVTTTKTSGDVPGNVESALQEAAATGYTDAVAVGAIPFRTDAPCELHLPVRTLRAPTTAVTRHARQAPTVPLATDFIPSQQQYLQRVHNALARFDQGALDKVVLARSLALTLSEPLDVPRLLANLAASDPQAYTFAAPLLTAPRTGPRPRMLIGASPELLVTRTGCHLETNPLAGSAPRSADPAEDQRRAADLLASAKDQHEHALVVDAVQTTLRPYCRTLSVPKTPKLLATATMWHLSTHIHGELADPATTSLTLALALHPTPAVCGHPTQAAREMIDEYEGDDRGCYAGAVGWCDRNGDGEWAVAIRCALIDYRQVRLFAGAGIVPGSQPQSELDETSAKFRAFCNALDLDLATAQTC